MSEGPVFIEPGLSPSDDALGDALGPSVGFWRDLVGRAETMGARGEWSWDGPKNGWSWRMKRAGKPFLSLAPRSRGFRALVILGREQAEQATSLPLGQRVRATYDSARQYPDGRWIFHFVECAEDVRDISLLLRLKLPPTIRARFELTVPAEPGAPDRPARRSEPAAPDAADSR